MKINKIYLVLLKDPFMVLDDKLSLSNDSPNSFKSSKAFVLLSSFGVTVTFSTELNKKNFPLFFPLKKTSICLKILLKNRAYLSPKLDYQNRQHL